MLFSHYLNSLIKFSLASYLMMLKNIHAIQYNAAAIARAEIRKLGRRQRPLHRLLRERPEREDDDARNKNQPQRPRAEPGGLQYYQ